MSYAAVVTGRLTALSYITAPRWGEYTYHYAKVNNIRIIIVTQQGWQVVIEEAQNSCWRIILILLVSHVSYSRATSMKKVIYCRLKVGPATASQYRYACHHQCRAIEYGHRHRRWSRSSFNNSRRATTYCTIRRRRTEEGWMVIRHWSSGRYHH